MDSVSNFCKIVMATNYDAAATSIVLTAAQYAKLPQTAPFNLVWWNHTDYPSPEDDPSVEIVRVTAMNSGTYTLTVSRGQEGTTAAAHNTAGKEYWLINGITKYVMDAIQTSLDGKAALSHTHAESDVTGLTTDLAGKAASVHTHAESDITNLTTDLSGKASTSHDHKRAVEIIVTAPATAVTTSDAVSFPAPSIINGMNLVRAQARVDTAGTTNATTVQVRNMTKYSSNDALSTAVSIASGATIGTAGTVNTSYDDVATDDVIKVYVTAISTTAPKGLTVVLEYQLP